MATSVMQSSFATGEVSPNLFARVDLPQYLSGAALLYNWFVDYRGGASTRTGTEAIARVANSAIRSRLIPFIFSQQQSYVLEFGDHTLRIISNGEQLLQPSKAITDISQANPAVVKAIGHGFVSGKEVALFNIVGMLNLNDRSFRVTVIDADTFSLASLGGVPIDSTQYRAYQSGGEAALIYEIATPWAWQDLPALKYAQSADVMTFTHYLYAVYNLSRTSASVFTLTAETYGAKLAAPINVSATPSAAGTLVYAYEVCAVTAHGERSLASVITVASYAQSEALDQNLGKIVDVLWEPADAATSDATDHYDIFKAGPMPGGGAVPTYLGYIGSSQSLEFVDSNIAPDFSITPPTHRDPFADGNFPACVTYFQQRKAYGGLAKSPEEIDFSQTGAYTNFDISLAVLDSDAIQIALASRQVNVIKSMVPTSTGLVVFTSGGAALVSGGSPTAAITPSNIVALPQASSGANDMPPIVVNYDILFAQAKSAGVRDLAFNFYIQTFYGYDRSAVANHLFFGFQLQEWAYVEEPFKVIWVVRNDGRLLSFTYVPEQEIYGWAHHATTGLFESVCSVPEGHEDALYAIVSRIENNVPVRYIERMASRHWVRVEDVWCLDHGIQHKLERPAYGLTVSASPTEAFLQTDDGSTPFGDEWLGRIIWFDVGGKMKVNFIVSPSQIDGEILEPLGNNIPGTKKYYPIVAGAWEWSTEISHIVGLEDYAGQTVSALADGEAYSGLVVTPEGTLDIPVPASKILVGYPYVCQLQTLKLEVGQPTIQGKRKLIAAVTLRMHEARGIKAGATFSEDDLVEYKGLPVAYTPPIPLFSRDERITTAGGWTEEGQVCVQQEYPFPATVLGIIPEVTGGDNLT